MATCDTNTLITVIPATQCVGDSLSAINVNFENLKNEIHDINHLFPAGIIMLFGGIDVPNSEWLICDGSYHDISTYNELYNVVGETYGPIIGDRFKIPDLRGRTAIGGNASNTNLTLRFPGQFGGTESATLSSFQIPSHTHLISNVPHTHTATQTSHNHGTVSINHPSHEVSDRGHTHNVYAGYIAGSNYLPTDLTDLTSAHYYGTLYALSPTVFFRHLHATGAGWTTGASNEFIINDSAATNGVQLSGGSTPLNYWVAPNVGTTNDTQLQITIASTPPVGRFATGGSGTPTTVANGISIDPITLTTSLSSVSPAITISTSTVSVSAQNTGGDYAHSNLQPFTVVNYIIKAFGCPRPGSVPPSAHPTNPVDLILPSTPPVTIHTVATPTITPNGGTGYIGSVEVEIACTTPNAIIYYTTNGSDPTAASPVYTGAFRLASNTTVKAKGSLVGWFDSSIANAIFGVAPSGAGTVLAPIITPGSGTYSPSATLTITCGTPGSAIHYTTNGADPSSTSTSYSVPFTITTSQTIKARAFAANLNDSPITTANYTIYASPPGTVQAPVITPDSGSYDSYVIVTMQSPTQGSTIYYTTDGSDPSTASNIYINPFPVSNSAQIKAKATKASMLDSTITTKNYTIINSSLNKVQTPQIIPNGGNFTINTYVTIICRNATIYYTRDGSTPGPQNPNSTLYTNGFFVTNTQTIKAIGLQAGFQPSDIAAATFTINFGSVENTVPSPQISPAGGSYNNSVQVTITDTDSLATIYYTTDGSTPVPGSGAATYTGAFTLDRTAVVKALATRIGYNVSSIATANFTINLTVSGFDTVYGEQTSATTYYVSNPQQVRIGIIQRACDNIIVDINASTAWNEITKANAVQIANTLKSGDGAYWGTSTGLTPSGLTGTLSVNGQTFTYTTYFDSEVGDERSGSSFGRDFFASVTLSGPQ